MSFNNDELLDELFEELLDDPDEDSSGNLSPRGMISIPAGFLRLSVAASADEIGVIDTIGLMSAFLDFETDELEFDEELFELGDGLAFSALISK